MKCLKTLYSSYYLTITASTILLTFNDDSHSYQLNVFSKGLPPLPPPPPTTHNLTKITPIL